MSAKPIIISALHAIEEKLKQADFSGEFLFCKKNSRIDKILDNCSKTGIRKRKLSQSELDSLAPSGHKGALLLIEEERSRAGKSRKDRFKNVDEMLSSKLSENALCIILDGITDPHNLGAVLRSADQFAADCVIVPDVRSAGSSSVVDQTSAGASMYVPLLKVKNVSREIKKLQENGFWVYGAAMNGQNAHETNLKGKVALVFGREGEGLHDLVSKTCDGLVQIPCNGNIDSLNVSVAAGILLYECRRQQQFIYT